MTIKDLRKMKLHETRHISGEQYVIVMRVIGGWIYNTYDIKMFTSVFVPDPFYIEPEGIEGVF